MSTSTTVCPDCDLILRRGEYKQHRDSGECGRIRRETGDQR